jgi:hypothetical protein
MLSSGAIREATESRCYCKMEGASRCKMGLKEKTVRENKAGKLDIPVVLELEIIFLNYNITSTAYHGGSNVVVRSSS